MSHVLWCTTLHGGVWEAKVTHHGDTGYQGILTVTDLRDGCIADAELVQIHYGGLFGPEPEDVTAWMHRAIDVIDRPELRVMTGTKRYQVERLTDLGWKIIGMYDTPQEAKIRVGEATNGNDVHVFDFIDKVVLED